MKAGDPGNSAIEPLVELVSVMELAPVAEPGLAKRDTGMGFAARYRVWKSSTRGSPFGAGDLPVALACESWSMVSVESAVDRVELLDSGRSILFEEA